MTKKSRYARDTREMWEAEAKDKREIRGERGREAREETGRTDLALGIAHADQVLFSHVSLNDKRDASSTNCGEG